MTVYLQVACRMWAQDLDALVYTSVEAYFEHIFVDTASVLVVAVTLNQTQLVVVVAVAAVLTEWLDQQKALNIKMKQIKDVNNRTTIFTTLQSEIIGL